MANVFYLSAFVVYLLIVLGIGVWGYRQTTSISDFWVYGKELGPWLATWSFVANFVSAASVIGIIGTIYGSGYSIMTTLILGEITGVFGLYLVSGRIRKLDKITFPDIVAVLSNREWSRPIVAVIMLANSWTFLILQLVGAGVLVTTVTGVPYEYMIWVIGSVFILYTILGGMVSVAWTDLIQGTLMVATIFVVFVFMFLDLDGLTAINTQFASLSSANVSPLGGETLFGIVASFVAFFGGLLSTQNHIIRINATKDVKTAKFHLAVAAVILGVFYVVLTLLGGATTVALSTSGITLQNIDKAFPVLITEYLPTSIGVVVILAVMSSILSTTDTRLHATGVTTARDIYDYFYPNSTDEQKLKVSRYATLLFGITAIILAINPPGTIIEIYDYRAVLLTSGLLIPVYYALYTDGTDGRTVLLSILLGVISGVGTKFNGDLFGIPPAFVGLGMALMGIAIGQLWWTDTVVTGKTSVSRDD